MRSASGRTRDAFVRYVGPRAAGLEEATRVFWPFLDGFEEQLEGWRLAEKDGAFTPLQKGTPPKNGKAALLAYLQQLRVTPAPGPLQPRLTAAVPGLTDALEMHIGQLARAQAARR